ncbi:monooxygenase, partial [Streptomyces parvus]|nr:monooxygenase [Streptomyces parvus]
GPRTTVLGFGPGSAAVLREVAAAYGDAGVRTCRVYAPYESGARSGPGTAVVDDEGHAAAAYGTGAFGDRDTGTGTDTDTDTDTGTVVVVRPDHHLGLSAPADDARSVHAYLRRLHGAGRPRNGSPALVDAARKG